ncbi:MAG: HNH endonuclease [Bacteroidales bacterium]|nr:HNH endonuclease [Candidatus Colicola equi]
MKNIKPYSGDSKVTYDEAVNRKKGGAQKNLLLKNAAWIHGRYDLYHKHFLSLNLSPVLSVLCPTVKLKDVLLSMYGYNAKAVRDIRSDIYKRQSKATKEFCQYCGIEEVGTMDHFLPKEEYPEYALNGENLFPCCSKCNDLKGEKDPSLFLNLYLDQLPTTQYLFVDIGIQNNDLSFRFYLHNDGKIDAALFAKIETHFKELDLLDRMRIAADGAQTDFIYRAKREFIKGLQVDFVSIVQDEVKYNKQYYGDNHWRYVWEDALVTSPVFWNYVSTL